MSTTDLVNIHYDRRVDQFHTRPCPGFRLWSADTTRVTFTEVIDGYLENAADVDTYVATVPAGFVEFFIAMVREEFGAALQPIGGGA